MRLRDLIAAVPEAVLHGDGEVEIVGLQYDSRQVEPGAAFVSVPSVGGHNGADRYVADALSRGAAAIVHEGGPVGGVATVSVPDARCALADLAAAFYGRPSSRLSLFLVTGTDGKTTTTYLLDGILSGTGLTTGLIGTVETKIGDRREPNLDRMTTPESLDVQRLLHDMVVNGVTHVAMEASSHALALHRLRGTEPAATALTNITGDHVEFHGSWRAYVAAKRSLFTEVGSGRPAVLNADDPYGARLALELGQRALTYGFSPSADLRAVVALETAHGTDAEVVWRGERETLHVALPGRYNVSNALAATGLALVAGLSLRDIAAAIARAQPPPGRMQRLDAGGVTVVVDYAHTVNAFRSALSAVRDRLPSGGRLIAVFGAAGDRDRAKRPYLAEIASVYADECIVTNEDPYGEDPEAIVDEILGGVPAGTTTRFHREMDRGRAIDLALHIAQSGDTVVILGKGHEQSIVSSGRKEPWSDIAAVRAARVQAR